MLLTAAVALAALCAGVMGYAIQRGATCTVAAVDELLTRRSARRLVAMIEASFWVAGGLALASVLRLLPRMPAAYSVGAWVVIGGALLGFGAWVNRACVFGAVARFGSGEWAYAATPVGYYLGCVTVGPLFAATAPVALTETSPLLRAPALVAGVFVVFAAWRVLPAAWSAIATGSAGTSEGTGPGTAAHARSGAVHHRLAQRVWTPHAATGVIGITFVIILLLVGVWAYTDVLAQLARGMSMRLGIGMLCLLALYAGAWLGGRTAGRSRSVPPTVVGTLRCLAGGLLMAWGSLLIPGSNDGLILIGMPLLRPYAWLAFATMCVTIAAAQLLGRGWASRVRERQAV